MSSKRKRRGSSESRGHILDERRAQRAVERARARLSALCTKHDKAVAAYTAELNAAKRAGPPGSERAADLVAAVAESFEGYDALLHQIAREREQDAAALGGRTDWMRELARVERAERGLQAELDAMTAARDALAADAITDSARIERAAQERAYGKGMTLLEQVRTARTALEAEVRGAIERGESWTDDAELPPALAAAFERVRRLMLAQRAVVDDAAGTPGRPALERMNAHQLEQLEALEDARAQHTAFIRELAARRRGGS